MNTFEIYLSFNQRCGRSESIFPMSVEELAPRPTRRTASYA